jgi:alanine racemase
MDQLMADCGDEEVQVGEEVVLIGQQENESIEADALGRLFGTIGYEIVSRIGERVPRRSS